jgi:demethylmenaquinone methyltransferase/2-methoxy-6-polyprenyl-1,4-benzoquinol methylase
VFDHFAFLAPFYDRLIAPPDAARLARLLRLPTAGWLLDGGGGTGRAALPLRRMVGNLVVSDVSAPMLAKARRKQLPAVGARVEKLPFADGWFDRVLVVDALHHFADPEAAIGELIRVLRPGGRLLIEEFDATRAAVKLLAAAEKLALMRSRFFRPDELREMLASGGLEVRIHTDRKPTVWVVGDKP